MNYLAASVTKLLRVTHSRAWVPAARCREMRFSRNLTPPILIDLIERR